MTEFPMPAAHADSTATTRGLPEASRTLSDASLMHEALARSRQQEAERAARQYRRARRLTAGRFWSRLAAWADRRADQARTGRGPGVVNTPATTG